jgi:hypothetical protein
MDTERFPDAPPAIRTLPKDRRGYPIPWFVPIINGEPDFRVVDPSRILEAHRRKLCWVCGRKITGRKSFTVGPMCVVNRVSAEPPSCLSCARFAVTACPFLSRPLAKRAALDGLPRQPAAGLMIERNPGVTVIWETASYHTIADNRHILFRFGAPLRTSWWREGRPATRAEILDSIETGLPALQRIAEMEGFESLASLRAYVERAVKLVPVEA